MPKQSSIRPGDIPFALRLAHSPEEGYEKLAEVLGSSTSAAHRAVSRLQTAGLLIPGTRRVNREALREFLVHGMRYAFPPNQGTETRGIPTAWSMPALDGLLPSGPVVVWPSEHGSVRGLSVEPLAPCVPHASRQDSWLYEMLALVDAIRLGQTRERALAAEAIEQRLKNADG